MQLIRMGGAFWTPPFLLDSHTEKSDARSNCRRFADHGSGHCRLAAGSQPITFEKGPIGSLCVPHMQWTTL
jgi:hypothetical protein